MKSLGIAHDSAELKKLIAENPDLPIVIEVSENIAWEGFAWTCCTSMSCSLDYVLDCELPFNDEHLYTDECEFKDDLGDYLSDLPENDGLSEEELNSLLKIELEKYKPYWRDVIVIFAE